MRKQLGRKAVTLNIRTIQKSPFPGFVYKGNQNVEMFHSDLSKAREFARRKELAYDVSLMTDAAEKENYKDLEILDANENRTE